MVRKEPPIIKHEHKEVCRATFCKEMEKLLERGVWVESRYRKREMEGKKQDWRHSFKRYKTPTFSNYELSKQERMGNEE